jgi:hypothetical protein
MKESEAIKGVVVSLREEGKTFTEIRDILEDDYNVVRTRQAVYALYKRAIESEYKTNEKLELTLDIVKLSAFGYKATEIVSILNNNGTNVSYNQVYSVIKENNTTRIKEITNSICTSIDEGMRNKLTANEIMRSLVCQGAIIKPDTFNNLVGTVTLWRIKQVTVHELVKMYRLTGDKNRVKDICKNLTFVSINDVEASVH